MVKVLSQYLCLKKPKPVTVVIANGKKSKKGTIDLNRFYIVMVSTERKTLLVLISFSASEGVYNSERNNKQIR